MSAFEKKLSTRLLCKTCIEVIAEPLKFEYSNSNYINRKHHPNWASLAKAASEDCPICIALVRRVPSSCVHDPHRRIKTIMEWSDATVQHAEIIDISSVEKEQPTRTYVHDPHRIIKKMFGNRNAPETIDEPSVEEEESTPKFNLEFHVEFGKSTFIDIDHNGRHDPFNTRFDSDNDRNSVNGFDNDNDLDLLYTYVQNFRPEGTSSIHDRGGKLSFPESTRAVRSWMDVCSREHDNCEGHDQPQSYPTRILELTDSGVRLVLTDQEPLSGPYAALSYCWGPPPYQFLRLSDTNMAELRSGVPSSQLPIAFREAINFTRNLGIRYLWIDCLCIIQIGPDHERDWLEQSSQMQDVYANCSICLALCRSECPEQSNFNGPEATFPLPIEVSLEYYFNKEMTASNPVSLIVPINYYKNALYNLPLGSRAWALQERLLPGRVIAFGVGEVFWSCNQLPDACETFPRGMLPFINEPRFELQRPSIPSEVNPRKLLIAWYEFVEDYSSRNLTYPERDKLVAISAVANRIALTMDDDYVEGHFWGSIPRSLLWSSRLLTSQGAGPRPGALKNSNAKSSESVRTSSRFPTWSWASVNGGIHFIDLFEYKYAAFGTAGIYEPLAFPEGYLVKGNQNAAHASPRSKVFLKLGILYIGGDLDWTNSSEEGHLYSFSARKPESIQKYVVSFTMVADDPDGMQKLLSEGKIKVVFCPLVSAKYSDDEYEPDHVKGVVQIETGKVVNNHKIFERLGCACLTLEKDISTPKTAKRLGLERRSIVLG